MFALRFASNSLYRTNTGSVSWRRNAASAPLWLLGALLLLCSGTASSEAAGAQAPLQVSVSIPPQRYFLQQIAGARLDVSVLLQQGADPHTFAPTPRQMGRLSHSRVLFTAGLSSELGWKGKLASLAPQLKIVEPNEQLDQHFWLSPPQVMHHVELMRAELVALDPDHAEDYTSGARRFVQQLEGVHRELQQLFSDTAGHNRFLVQHPAWDVFAAEYALQQIVIEEQGKSVTVGRLAELLRSARELGIETVFADSGHSTREASVIAGQIGAEVLVLDPMHGDWLSNLRSAASAIRSGLR